MNNTNNVVLITGASSGFGRLIAELLSKNNFQVIATMRDISGKNSKIARELDGLSKNVTIEELDVTCSNSIKTAVKNTINSFIHFILSVAGILPII